ncbi:excisionase family DNA-binding protein [Paraburkholderia sp. RL17-337-BIB-A]|uniref:excisionase family DNA-binding protein n=1 Tax=Paraburkholderia sp. RL17-337-BIB-A TaxID=3031636 RepID=UPI0038BDC665
MAKAGRYRVHSLTHAGPTGRHPISCSTNNQAWTMKIRVMTIAEIATRLNVSRPYVRRLIAEKRLRTIWGLCSEPVIDRAEAEKYIGAAKARQRVAMEVYIRASQDLEVAIQVGRNYDDFLSAAKMPELTESSRLRCAFDAMYELCKAVVDLEVLRANIGTDNPLAFASGVVEQAASSMKWSADDIEHVFALCTWAVDVSPLPPLPLSPDDAVALAERVLAAYLAAQARREVELELPADGNHQVKTDMPRGNWRNDFERLARRHRRRLVRNDMLLPAGAFCQRRGISPDELARLERRREMFGIEIARKMYYPVPLADIPRTQRARLARMCRLFTEHVPVWSRWDTLVSPRGSLGGITGLRALRYGASYRQALKLAKGISEDWRPRW